MAAVCCHCNGRKANVLAVSVPQLVASVPLVEPPVALTDLLSLLSHLW